MIGRSIQHIITATVGVSVGLYFSQTRLYKWISSKYSNHLTYKDLEKSVQKVENCVKDASDSIKKDTDECTQKLQSQIAALNQELIQLKHSISVPHIDPDTLVKKGLKGLISHFGVKNTKVICNEAINIVSEDISNKSSLICFGDNISFDLESFNNSNNKLSIAVFLPHTKGENVKFKNSDEIDLQVDFLALERGAELPENIYPSHVLRVDMEDGSLIYDQEFFLESALESNLPKHLEDLIIAA